MKSKSIRWEYSKTIQPRQYESVRVSHEQTVELDRGDDPAVVLARLQKRVRREVHSEIRRLMREYEE